ncbi:histidine kinase dimerization/phosphoacceptor domain -containing protein [Aurantimonas sp. Leaf443]|uniref:sensor histidine kinase n=1 Tax=Aurantimonas sp. Leaf443 TaxID=1736378 RepID=UPI000A9F3E27|nr:histidine kinase dimerization/phosphoacceptor domain -containing protein [Aurantimonas sp. Leaf443]
MPSILYIDDDEGLRTLTERAMRRRGFAMRTAEGGDEGLEILRRERFDLIAIDHYMPGRDGLETLAMLREALPVLPPVVYVTGSEESRVAVAALKAGAADYVVKTVGEDFFDLLATSFANALERAALVGAKSQAEAALKASNERLEALLKETNHRIANSLQIVSTFVNMQASALANEDARQALRNTQQRIRAIGQVHRRLYTSNDIETVDMADYLDALALDLEETWSTPASPRRVRVSAPPFRLKTDRAVSVGVIVNELISNACKYAYPAGTAGEIRVTATLEGEAFCIHVEDDGCGMASGGAAPPKGTGIGGKLVRAMAQSLKAEIEHRPGAGVSVALRADL